MHSTKAQEESTAGAKVRHGLLWDNQSSFPHSSTGQDTPLLESCCWGDISLCSSQMLWQRQGDGRDSAVGDPLEEKNPHPAWLVVALDG